MTKAKIIWLVNSSLLTCSAFILCAALGMLLNPEAFHKFFSPVQLVSDLNLPFPHKSYYWDLKAYAEMALSNRCVAYYPLWPLLIRILFHPQSVDQAAHSFLLVSTGIFLLATPLLIALFRKSFRHHYLAFLLVLAFALNPMAIFRVIGYTESLFSALSAIFIWICLRQTNLTEKVRLVLVFCVTFIMSLTRPILMPFLFSSVAALGTIFFFESLKLETRDWRSFLIQIKNYAQEIKITLTLCISALLGYSMYGFFCFHSRGNFFAPFIDQKNWGTKLGFHLELLLFPKSPLFDLWGLYFPLMVMLLALILVYFKIKNKTPLVWIPKSPLWNVLLLYPPLLILSYIVNYLRLKNKSLIGDGSLTKVTTSDYTKTLSRNYLFWFCVYFPVFHSVLIFFTRDRLYSLGRYIFGVPFFFMALGYLCCCIPGKRTYQALLGLIFISAITLVEQWVNYGKHNWLG
jgi:hypothetical protein